MIHRIVLMKLNARADDDVIDRMQTYVGRIREEVAGTRTYHMAPNEGAGDGDFNWVLTSSFDNEDDMNAYRVAPLHQAFVAYCDPYTDDFLAAYYRAPEA